MGSVAKCLLFVVNLLVFIGGLSMLGLGIWALQGTASFQELVTDHSGVTNGVYAIIAAGALLIIIGFFGCCGAIKENKCMLGVFFAMLFVIFCVEIAGASLAYSKQAEFEDLVHKSMELYDSGSTKAESITITQAWNAVHNTFDCCGYESPKDWEQFSSKLSSTKLPECYSSQKPGCKHAFNKYVVVVAGVAVGVLFVEMFSMMLACWLIHKMGNDVHC